MKRVFVILAAALVALTACNKELKTETLKVDEKVKLSENSRFSLGLVLDIDFPVSGFSDEAIANMRRAIRTKLLGEAYAGYEGSLDELARDFTRQQAAEYISSNEEMLKEMQADEDEFNNLNWNVETSGAFAERYKNWINYFYDDFLYLGGAHGINTHVPLVFDVNTGELASYRDFTGTVSEERLKELLDKHKFDNLDLDEDIDRNDVFYVEEIEPSAFFSVDGKGITFYYQPYELAAYVFGTITIPVPWEEL